MIINEIVFLIFFPDSFLLMCRNPTDFYMLILYPEVLVNLFLSSNSFWWYYIVSCHLQILTVLLLPFKFRFLLFLSPVLFLQLELSILCWTSGTSAHSCLVSNLRNKAFDFSVLIMILAESVMFSIYYIEVYFLHTHFVEN